MGQRIRRYRQECQEGGTRKGKERRYEGEEMKIERNGGREGRKGKAGRNRGREGTVG